MFAYVVELLPFTFHFRIEIRQVREIQLHAPGHTAERSFAGLVLLVPLRLVPAPLRFAPFGSLLPPPGCRLGSALLRLQRRDLRVELLDFPPRLGRLRRIPRVRQPGLPGPKPPPPRARQPGPASGAGDRSSQRCFAAGPMCADGGLSRRRSSSFASPASRARASCAAWLSAVTLSTTPARSNARFISAAHACRVSSSHARGFVRSLFRAPPVAGSPPLRRRPPEPLLGRPRHAVVHPPRRTRGAGAGCPPPPPPSRCRRAAPACTAADPPSRARRSCAPDRAAPRSPASWAAPPSATRNNRPLLRSWLSAAAQYSRASDDANAGIEPDSRCTTSSWRARAYWPTRLM